MPPAPAPAMDPTQAMAGGAMPDEGPKFSVTLRIKSKQGRPRVWNIPPDEALVPPRYNSISLEDAPYFGHRRRRTRSDLIASGYDAEQVNGLPIAGDAENDEERRRFEGRRSFEESDDTTPADASMEEVWTCEHYIRCDYDGDGIAELRKVTVAGTSREILRWGDDPPAGRDPGSLDNEEVDEIPVAAITPVLMSHRFWGRSIVELVVDLQRIKTVLMRQMLDNVYLNNFPMVEVSEPGIAESTIDDLLSPKPRNIIRTALPGMLNTIQPPVMVDQALAAIEFVNSVQENRTGVTRYNQGLDADSLNKTATGVNRIMQAAERKKMLIARIFAETGIKRLFQGLHGLLQKHSPKKRAFRLRNKWVDVDPREWKTRKDMSVAVGLGTGNKDQILGHLTQILQYQIQAIMQPTLGLVKPKNLYNTLAKMVENAGLKSVEPYFTDPDQNPPQQGGDKPDPALQMAQMQADIEKQRMQMEGQKAQAEMALRAQEFELKKWQAQQQDDRERDKLDAQIRLQADELQMKYQMQVNVAAIKADVDRDRTMMQAHAGIQQAGMRDATQRAGMDQQAQMADAQRQQDMQQAEAQRQHAGEQAEAERAAQAQQAAQQAQQQLSEPPA